MVANVLITLLASFIIVRTNLMIASSDTTKVAIICSKEA